MLGARAVALAGVSGTVAAASTIVDVTLEFIAQLAYTALGLAWLAQLRPDSAVALPITIGLGVASITAVLLLAVQRRGIGYIDRIAERLGEGWAERTASGAAALHMPSPRSTATAADCGGASRCIWAAGSPAPPRHGPRCGSPESRSGSTPCWSSSA